MLTKDNEIVMVMLSEDNKENQNMNDMDKMKFYRENYSALHRIAREFDRSTAEEIIARIFCGETVDCAIQSVICGDMA